MNTLDICFTINDNHSPYMATTMISILKNSKYNQDINFHIISDNISKDNIEK